MDKIYRLWLPVLGWAGLIFVLSSIPNLRSSLSYDLFMRKIAHIIEYAILTFLLLRAFQHSFNLTVLDLVVYPIIIAIIYAISDEFHQTFVIGRRCEFKDVLIDCVGVFGLYLTILIIRRFRELKK